MTHPQLTPEQQAVIRALNGLAKELTHMPHPERSKQAREAGLQKVLAARPKHDTTNRRLFFAVPAAAFAALALLLIIAGSALPGQKLYALKRSTENVRDTLTFSTVGKANNCSRLMQTRANEFASLSKDKKRLSETTVDTIIGDILNEAKEFEEYISQAPTDKQPDLRIKRQSDAATVASVLIKIDSSTIPDSRQQNVKETIATLRRIADG